MWGVLTSAHGGRGADGGFRGFLGEPSEPLFFLGTIKVFLRVAACFFFRASTMPHTVSVPFLMTLESLDAMRRAFATAIAASTLALLAAILALLSAIVSHICFYFKI